MNNKTRGSSCNSPKKYIHSLLSSRVVSDISVRSGISTASFTERSNDRDWRYKYWGEITGRQSEDGTTSQDIKMRTSRILIIFAFSLATANAIFLEKKLFLINKLKHKLGHKLGHKLDKLGKSGVRLMISHYDDFSRTGT